MYLRWLQWMLHSVHENHNTVVINMDETSMSNVTRWKRGWAVCSRPGPHERKRHKPKPAREMKITLIAAICNRPDMQITLQQVLLPKHPGGRTPGKRILKLWEDMGPPLQVWHNTGGWNNAGDDPMAALHFGLGEVPCAGHADRSNHGLFFRRHVGKDSADMPPLAH